MDLLNGSSYGAENDGKVECTRLTPFVVGFVLDSTDILRGDSRDRSIILRIPSDQGPFA
jgi:hypothetical protein